MDHLIELFEQVALLGLTALAVLIVDLYRRLHRQAIELTQIQTRLDSGDKKFDELRAEIQALRDQLQHVSNDVARILGLLEHRDHEK